MITKKMVNGKLEITNTNKQTITQQELEEAEVKIIAKVVYEKSLVDDKYADTLLKIRENLNEFN